MLIQLNRKKKEGLINESRVVKAKSNFSEFAFFSFWFNSINFYLPRVSICRNQSIAKIGKIDELNTGIAAKNLNIGIASTKKADKPYTGIEIEDRNIDKAGTGEVEGVKDPSINRTDVKKADGVENPEKDIVDIEKAWSIRLRHKHNRCREKR